MEEYKVKDKEADIILRVHLLCQAGILRLQRYSIKAYFRVVPPGNGT
jgi:hypothetical protein